MANIKSQKKRNITNERNRQRNVAVKSRVKTYIKSTMSAIEAKDTTKVGELLTQTLSEIDRAASKGIIHANSAARKKSHLQHLASSLK